MRRKRVWINLYVKIQYAVNAEAEYIEISMADMQMPIS